jgi:hypothetical protein
MVQAAACQATVGKQAASSAQLHTQHVLLACLQVWLLLYNLLADGTARSRMEMSEARCEALLKLKRHFNELLLDQARNGVTAACPTAVMIRRI